MKKIIVFIFACFLIFILIGCNSKENNKDLNVNNDGEIINQGSDDLGEEKLGSNENNEENPTEDPIEVTQEDKFVMVEDDTIFTFPESDGGKSYAGGVLFTVAYDDDDVLFYCKIDNGSLNNRFGLGERVYLKELVVKNGDRFEWLLAMADNDNFFEAVFKKDNNIVGYAVVLGEISRGLVEGGQPYSNYKYLKSVVFPKVDGEYQNITEEDVKELINQAKNSINKEFKFNYDNCVEIDYELKACSYAPIDETHMYWSSCILNDVLSCEKVLNNFDDLFNSFEYFRLKASKYTHALDRFNGIDNLEEHKDLFELDFDNRSVIVISETKVDEINDIKVYVDNNRNLCVRIEGKDTNYGGRLNDNYGDKYYYIREWLFIEVVKIDGLDYTDAYADIIVTNNTN